VSYHYQRREADLGGYHYQRREADLGAVSLARYRRVGRGHSARAIAERHQAQAHLKHATRSGLHPALRPLGTTHYTVGDCDQLGFSLKPPKFVRKAAKKVGKFVAKHKTAFLVGAGVLTAGLLAPGAALAVGKGALTAGKFAGRGAKGLFGKLIPHGKAKPPPDFGPPDAGYPDAGVPPQPQIPSAPRLPDLTMPASPGEVASSGGSSYGGGGGGAPVDSGDVPGAGEGEAADQTQAPTAKPAINPMVILGGAAVLGLAFAGGRSSRKR
jgi:hypothetical protein